MRDIGGIARPAQQMIGAGERDEAFWVFCRREDAAGIIDADGCIGGRVKDQERLAKPGNPRGEILLGDVVEQGAADAEGAPGKRYFDLAFAFYVFNAFAE